MSSRPDPSKTGPSNRLLGDQRVNLVDSPTAEPQQEQENPKISVALQGRGPGRHHEGARILAKGEGDIAEQILQLAFEKGIKVRTDSDLAEILSHLDVDSEIPLEALAAVATILNYVYKYQPGKTGTDSAYPVSKSHPAQPEGDSVQTTQATQRLTPAEVKELQNALPLATGKKLQIEHDPSETPEDGKPESH
ncbi:EscU/YscU/HrcU family type III secretion system export apparatus switch protein [Kiloniella sp. b19]|uniref:EscU/YscU/HrcU family type III secretion system export apparatus switch protein n=1 Tax=Kiloniella sp. GXU_MW_B19 TaxID=3141326 RepID=UPI0031D341B9